METIAGHLLQVHPLLSLEKRADLVYFDGPLLSLFENRDGEPFLFLWADVDEQAHRWIVVRVSPERLSAYLRRGLPLRELVLNPSDGYLFIADIAGPDDFKQVRLLTPDELPTGYLPSPDSYYEFTPEHSEVDLLSLARRYQSPLLDVHLLRGKGIYFGTADVITLGSVLRSTGELAEAVAVSLFANRTDGERLNREEARAYGQFEYLTQRAASFSAILRPIVTQENFVGFDDRTGEVVQVILDLLTTTPDYAGLQRAATHHQEDVIRHLEIFAKDVLERDIVVEVRWATPEGDIVAEAKVDPWLSTKIIDNINRLELEESEGFWNNGVFLAVDTKLRSYRFMSAAGRESTGRFDAKMSYPVTHISFETEYRVYMNRRTSKASGRTKPKITETIGEIVPLSDFVV